MCGISGIVDFSGIANYGGIEYIIKNQRHRGPDNMIIWKSVDSKCVLGHNRLSIIDLTEAGNQPMIDKNTGNAITYNGEVYNFKRLRDHCEEKGDFFETRTDTEVILKLYNHYGIDCLKYLRGMFAFAIWNSKKQRLFFARDRLGVKPLIYTLNNKRLFIASEIYALTKHPEISKELDIEALNLYLQFQYIPAPWTIYKSVKKLLPGYYGIFDKNGLKLYNYWELDYCKKVSLSEQEAIERLKEKLKECVALRMVADVPIGALLSGGVDSSLIVALMSEVSNKPVKTFSIGFKEKDFNELPYAKRVAKKYQTEHYPIIIDGNIHDVLPLIIRHYGEPFADKGAIPAFYVAKSARQYVKVALCGDGGDELLGGYPRYNLYNFALLISGRIFKEFNIEKILNKIQKIQQPNSIIKLLYRKVYMSFFRPEIQTIIYDSYWGDNIRKKLLKIDSAIMNSLYEWRRKLLKGSIIHADNLIDRMLWIDNKAYLIGDGVLKMDIASMHCSLEVRSPLLDHELITFCASLPPNLKVKKRKGKYLLKKLAELYIPKDIIWRKKKGFSIPVSEWLKGPLLPLIKEYIFNSKLMEPMDIRLIKSVFKEFMNGNDRHKYRLWILLIYGMWRDIV